MPNLEVKIDGLNELMDIFEDLPREIQANVTKEMNQIAKEAVEEATANAPILTGDLRMTITGVVDVVGDDIQLEITADTEYALILHENLFWQLGPISAQQPTTPSGGVGPKYIERVFMYHIFEWQERIGKAIVGEK